MQDIAVYNAAIWIGLHFLICIEVCKAWQCANEKKVRDCQVEKVYITALPLGQTKDVTKYNQKVSRETNTKLYEIDR